MNWDHSDWTEMSGDYTRTDFNLPAIRSYGR